MTLIKKRCIFAVRYTKEQTCHNRWCNEVYLFVNEKEINSINNNKQLVAQL